ncbi:MAG: hypothetical protein ACOVNV_10835, partial [Pirellulaceae bacterium]
MQRKLPERLELFDQPREPRDLTLKKSLQRWQADVERIEWQRKQRATQPTFVGLDESLLLIVPCDSISEPSFDLGEKAIWIGCGKPQVERLPDAWQIPASEMPEQPDSAWNGLWIATFRQPLPQSEGMQRWRFDQLRWISSDIASMHLRYHDGQQWKTSWSGGFTPLPAAIEIQCHRSASQPSFGLHAAPSTDGAGAPDPDRLLPSLDHHSVGHSQQCSDGTGSGVARGRSWRPLCEDVA